MTLTHGSLFSGAGMLDEGVQSVLGGELSWYAEFDAAASKVMAHHYPGIPNLGDVTKVDWASVPHVDILTGGSPCQDLSHAGKRAGMTAGTRSNMGEGKTVESWDEWTDRMKAKHGNGNGHGASLAIEAQRLLLLPTPKTTDAQHSSPADLKRHDPGLRAVSDLLPTPRATDGNKGGPNQRGSSGDLMLPSAVQPTRWGQYVPAIARWEAILGRPAPAPTEATSKGTQRLSSRFVEWLMGCLAGWVTDLGLTRNEELKILGNSVVRQQAAAATWAWVCDMRAERAA